MMIMNKENIKTEVKRFGFFVLLSFVILSCNQQSLTGTQIIEKAIEAHGGIDRWQGLKQLSFNKKTSLFYEDGSVEIEINQSQLFRFGDAPYGKIEWTNADQEKIKIVLENSKISKSVNDSIIDSKQELEQANSSFWAAYYVACKPFDLLGGAAKAKRVEDLSFNEKECYVVEIDYGDEEDHWFYIIDPETFEVVANKVELKDHTSWIDNLTFDTSTAFKFNAHRQSYRLNEKGEKTYLRAEYYYSNYKIE